MKKITSLLALLLFTNIILLGQYRVELPKKPHGLGFAAGTTSGYGLSYKYFPNKFGFTINTVFYIEKIEKNLDIGGMLKYSLNESHYHKFFAYYSAYYRYRYDRYITFPNTYPYNPVWVVDEVSRFSTGPGFGVELFNYRLSFVMHVGVGAYNNFRTFSMLAGGAGIYYRF